MKGYILSFFMMLAALMLSTLSFLVHNVDVVYSLPGIVLAAIVLLRMRYVRRKGLDERRHALALVCGWLFFFFILIGPVYVDDYPVYSMSIVLGWGLAIAMACLYHRYRSVAVGAAGVVVWLAFIFLTIPTWGEYCEKVRSAREHKTEKCRKVEARSADAGSTLSVVTVGTTSDVQALACRALSYSRRDGFPCGFFVLRRSVRGFVACPSAGIWAVSEARKRGDNAVFIHRPVLYKYTLTTVYLCNTADAQLREN